MKSRKVILRWAVGALSVAAVTLAGRLIGLNATTVGFVFLDATRRATDSSASLEAVAPRATSTPLATPPTARGR
jgi:hypothetical protein